MNNIKPKDVVIHKYVTLCNKVSDINQHLPTLKEHASHCTSILECGVRDAVSTWAFLAGLLENNSATKKLTNCDIYRSPNIKTVGDFAGKCEVDYEFVTGNDLEVDLPDADLIFIDTWHVYAQLKRELALFAPKAKKYIILHDTTVDAERGETLRMGYNAQKQARETGFPIEEIKKGLWPAVTEFLDSNTEWKLKKRYTNNNGLTILEKKP